MTKVIDWTYERLEEIEIKEIKKHKNYQVLIFWNWFTWYFNIKVLSKEIKFYIWQLLNIEIRQFNDGRKLPLLVKYTKLLKTN